MFGHLAGVSKLKMGRIVVGGHEGFRLFELGLWLTLFSCLILGNLG